MGVQGDLAKLLAGLPIEVPGVNIAITQPSVKDIAAFGEDDFFMGLQMLIKAESVIAPIKEGNPQLAMLDTFQLLVVGMNQDVHMRLLIENFLNFIMPDYEIQLAPGSINFKFPEVNQVVGQLNPMNFESFQQTLQSCFLPLNLDADDTPEYNPVNEQAAAIAEKLRKGAEKVKKLKAMENDKDPVRSLLANYASVLSIGLGIDVNVILNYTLFQLFDGFRRYTTKMQFDLYQKVSTTPMMDTSKMKVPDDWLSNIYK